MIKPTREPARLWSREDEEELIARAEAGQKNSFIAREMDRTTDAVTNKRGSLARQGRVAPLRQQWTEVERDQLRRDHEAGVPNAVSARMMGKTIMAIQSQKWNMKLDCAMDDHIRFVRQIKKASDRLLELLIEHHGEAA